MEMTSASAIEALGALAQDHRLALFRLLVQAGETGLTAGAIARRARRAVAKAESEQLAVGVGA